MNMAAMGDVVPAGGAHGGAAELAARAQTLPGKIAKLRADLEQVRHALSPDPTLDAVVVPGIPARKRGRGVAAEVIASSLDDCTSQLQRLQTRADDTAQFISGVVATLGTVSIEVQAKQEENARLQGQIQDSERDIAEQKAQLQTLGELNEALTQDTLAHVGLIAQVADTTASEWTETKFGSRIQHMALRRPFGFACRKFSMVTGTSIASTDDIAAGIQASVPALWGLVGHLDGASAAFRAQIERVDAFHEDPKPPALDAALAALAKQDAAVATQWNAAVAGCATYLGEARDKFVSTIHNASANLTREHIQNTLLPAVVRQYPNILWLLLYQTIWGADRPTPPIVETWINGHVVEADRATFLTRLLSFVHAECAEVVEGAGAAPAPASIPVPTSAPAAGAGGRGRQLSRQGGARERSRSAERREPTTGRARSRSRSPAPADAFAAGPAQRGYISQGEASDGSQVPF